MVIATAAGCLDRDQTGARECALSSMEASHKNDTTRLVSELRSKMVRASHAE
jgi:hypothetical protein